MNSAHNSGYFAFWMVMIMEICSLDSRPNGLEMTSAGSTPTTDTTTMSKEVEDDKTSGVKQDSGEGEHEDCYLVEEDEASKMAKKRSREERQQMEEHSEHEESDKDTRHTENLHVSQERLSAPVPPNGIDSPTHDERRALIERYAAGTLQSEDSVGMEHDGLYPTSPGRSMEGNVPLSPGNLSDVSTSRPMRCSDCGFHCESEQSFVAHCEEHSHEQHLMCALCKRSFSKKQSLRRHMNLHSGHRPFKCPFCEYRSSRKDHLKLHMRTRHDPGQSKQFIYKCPVCGNSFPSQKRMVNHMKSHQQTLHRCDLCEMTFPSTAAYEYHKKTKHVHATIACAPVTEGGPYMCPTCRCAFSSPEDYAQHLQSQRHKDMVTASVRVPQVARRLVVGDSQEQSIEIVTDADPAAMAAAAAAAAAAGMVPREDLSPSRQARSPSHIPGTSEQNQLPVTMNGPHAMPLSLVKIPAIMVQASSSTETDDSWQHSPSHQPQGHYHQSHSPKPRKTLGETGKQAALQVVSLSSGGSGDSSLSARSSSPRETNQLHVTSEGVSVIGSDTGSPAGYVPIPTALMPQRSNSPAAGQLPSSRQESTASSASIGKLNGSHSFNSSISFNSSFRSSSLESHMSSQLSSQLSRELSSQLSTEAPSDIMGHRIPIMRDNSTQDTVWRCQYCHIVFPDNILFAIHMGCHDLRNPFQCNICSFQCQDRYEFTSHITRGLHDTEH